MKEIQNEKKKTLRTKKMEEVLVINTCLPQSWSVIDLTFSPNNTMFHLKLM